jgi:hypothetical protein
VRIGERSDKAPVTGDVEDRSCPTVVDNLGIPPLAGLCTYEEAARSGLSIDQTVTFLRRYNFVLRRLHEVAAAHLPGTAQWEVKCALGLHLWIDAEHCAALRARIAEMRVPPLGLDVVPDAHLQAALEELLRAGNTVELLAGVYGAVRPALREAIIRHLERCNPLFDHPTVRVLRTVLREQEEILDWGERALEALTNGREAAAQADAFRTQVGSYITAAGGVGGDLTRPAESALPAPRWDGSEYEMELQPHRDQRFREPFNATAQIDDYYQDSSLPADERTFALAYKRLREMDVPEWMAPIIFRTRGKPFEYYRDLSRQLWDETRHAMMGEVALYRCGVPFYAYPIDMVASYTLNLQFTPLEAHLLLWYIEQGLMPRRTGKRFEWQIAAAYGDPFFVALQDYDWADEVLHAQIGRRWLEDDLPGSGRRRELGADLYARWEKAMEDQHGRFEQIAWWEEFVARARADSGLSSPPAVRPISVQDA